MIQRWRLPGFSFPRGKAMSQMSDREGSFIRLSVVLLAVLAAAVPMPVLAQNVVVQGRVFTVGSAVVIPNATVDLEGYGSTLTSDAGTFRFEDVRATWSAGLGGKCGRSFSGPSVDGQPRVYLPFQATIA